MFQSKVKRDGSTVRIIFVRVTIDDLVGTEAHKQTCDLVAKRFLCIFLHLFASFCIEKFYLQHLHLGSHNASWTSICNLMCILRGFCEMSYILFLPAKNLNKTCL